MTRGRGGLLALLAVAAALRGAWWAGYVDVIENEGVEYARLAWSWFHGRGYVSVFGGTHTLFPPLYPLLIGLAAPLAGSEEAAARAVSFAAGLALVGAVYALAGRVLGRRAALLAGALAACHPLLVALSAATYSEGLYVALCAGGALAAVACVERPSLGRAAAAGACAGLAYLTRPEGIALAAALAALIGLAGAARERALGRPALRAAVVLGAALVVAAPYALHLSRVAGGFRWEGKSWMNNAIGARQREGLDTIEAVRGLGPDAEPLGPYLFADQHARMAQPPRRGTGLLDVVRQDPVGRAAALVGALLFARPLGAPVVLALALAGLTATRWWRARLFEGAALVVWPGVAGAALLAVDFTWERYLFPLLPGLLVWAAAGADWVAAAAARRAVLLGVPARAGALARPLGAAALAAGVVLLSARNVTEVGELNQTRNTDVRQAGGWLRADHAARRGERAGRPRIAGIGLALAHYAEGEVVYLPAADEARALRYLRRLAPDYLALRESELHQTPYARAWFERGVADPCAEPVRELPPLAAARFRVWRWTCAEAPAARAGAPGGG